MTTPAYEPWVIVDTARTCGKCGLTIWSGSKARRTRGVERHMGGWMCEACG